MQYMPVYALLLAGLALTKIGLGSILAPLPPTRYSIIERAKMFFSAGGLHI